MELLPSRPAQRPTKITRITRYEGQDAIGSEIIFEAGIAETFTGRDAANAIGTVWKTLAEQGPKDADIAEAASAAVQEGLSR